MSSVRHEAVHHSGNHENWEWINEQEYDDDGLHWVSERVAICERNSVIQVEDRKVLSLGGATSVDRSLRVPRRSWWPEEEITAGDLLTLQDVMDHVGDIDIMVCHDAPGGGTDAVQDILNIPPHLSIFPTEGIIAAGEHRNGNVTKYSRLIREPEQPTREPVGARAES